MVVIELHPRDPGVWRRECPEGGHATAIDVERADWEEVEKETIRGLGGVGDMLAKVGVVGDGVEGWWIEFGEGGVRVLAVETFLETIDPGE